MPSSAHIFHLTALPPDFPLKPDSFFVFLMLMRQYVLDELTKKELDAIKGILKERLEQGGTDNIFWLNIPDDLLSPIQYEHKRCQPYSMAIEVGDSWVKFEELVRSRVNLHCGCIAYATPGQRDFLRRFIDSILKELG